MTHNARAPKKLAKIRWCNFFQHQYHVTDGLTRMCFFGPKGIEHVLHRKLSREKLWRIMWPVRLSQGHALSSLNSQHPFPLNTHSTVTPALGPVKPPSLPSSGWSPNPFLGGPARVGHDKRREEDKRNRKKEFPLLIRK